MEGGSLGGWHVHLRSLTSLSLDPGHSLAKDDNEIDNEVVDFIVS